MSQKEKAPVKYYELVEKKGSGFIMDGTGGTAYQQELNTPSIRWIPTKGRTSVLAEDGKTKAFKEIRYLNGCDTIDIDQQKAKGFVERPFEDKIGMENGFMSVAREGNSINLYDYLEKSFYNLDNPDRPESATAIYREVKLDKKAEVLLDEDELITRAKSLVYELRLNTGNKKTPYKYNEDRINAICRLVNVWDETPERKLIHLIQKANQNPKEFLEIVEKSEQTVITEVSHALEMNLIYFEGNTAQYTEEKKIIFAIGSGKFTQDQRIEQLASWFGTEEGNPALTEFRAKLEVAKEKALAN